MSRLRVSTDRLGPPWTRITGDEIRCLRLPVKHRILTVALATLMLAAGPVGAAKPPATWDGLVQVKSKRLDLVYLQPGADFRGYTKVMLDPTEIAFEKNWRREYNNTTLGLSQRVSETELQKLIVEGVQKATDLFAEACTEGG